MRATKLETLGLDHFQDHSSLRILSRFITNCIICCVASATTVPWQLTVLRAHLVRHLDLADDPKWKLSGLMAQYASLRSGIRRSIWSLQDCIAMALHLDQRLLELSQNMPREWQPETRILSHPAPGVYDRRVDCYRDRHVTQTWNVLRLVRILLCGFLLESYQDNTAGGGIFVSETALHSIATLTYEICASVYVVARKPGSRPDAMIAWPCPLRAWTRRTICIRRRGS